VRAAENGMATSTALALDEPLSSLATGAAHDLRNLLFVIRAHCDRLAAAVPEQDPHRADLDAIQDAVDRGALLASQLVTAGRTRARSRPADVNETIRALEALIQRLVGDRVTVTMRLSQASWPVTANRVQIEQVVMNLAINARDAMSDGGCLTIATENRTLGGAAAGQAAQFVVIEVTDTGAGIEPSIQDRVFEPYFTTKGNKGTGVGLATVRAIALLNGGHVEMITSPGFGTTMRVVLPRRPEAPVASAPAGPRRTVPIARRRILLIENERAIRDYLQRCLTAEGYQVDTASGGAEALGFCDPLLPAADVIVTDINLPDLAGPVVASQLRAAWPGVGLVFISGDSERLAELGDGSRVPVLAKPFTTMELLAAVRAVLSGQGM
jgi:two-component system cell cycle sensor histidine kinase/response regulator CckA